MKKSTRFTSFLLATLLCGTVFFASCSQNKNSEETQETERDASDDIQIDGSYDIVYTTNRDGTCYVSDIRFFGNVKDLMLEIPELSPAGDRVVAYDTNALVCPDFARMFLPDDFETLIREPVMQAVKRGELSEFMGKKITEGFFYFKSLQNIKDEEEKAALLAEYPILAISDLYVLSADMTSTEWNYLLSYIEAYAAYSPTEGVAASNRLILLCEQNAIDTSWIKSPIDPTQLKGIRFPDSLERVGEDVFYGCTSLTEVENGVSYVGGWAIACDENITELRLRNGTVGGADAAFAESKIQTAVLPDGIRHLGRDAFFECADLKEITLGEGLIRIGEGAFYKCRALKSIYFPKSLKSIGEDAFDYCPAMNIHIADLESWVGLTFEGAYSYPVGKLYVNGQQLTHIEIPDSVTEIKEMAFSSCQGLVSITVPDTVISIGSSAFANREELESLTLGKNVELIGASCFAGCINLKELIIPDSVKVILNDAFRDCEKLLQVENGVTYVDKWVVDCDPTLTDVFLREDTVGFTNDAFDGYDGSKLTNLVMPKTLKHIGQNAFYGCFDLIRIFYEGTVEDWSVIAEDVRKDETLSYATVFFYSEAQPTASGKYWRYVEGVPTEW